MIEVKITANLREKIRIYNTIILPMVLYGCKTWSLTKGGTKTVDV
jgi:hypothetical protein